MSVSLSYFKCLRKTVKEKHDLIQVLAVLYILIIFNDHQSLPPLITLLFVYAGDVGM